jgi:ABC-type nitrate/sulfonate/bicarbonate transport system substrate-binding protein
MTTPLNTYSVLGVIAAVAVGACASHAARADMLSLRYGQAFSSAHSIFSLPISTAQREGFFRREGLNVKVLVPIPGGSDKMITAMDDDFVDITHVATPFLIRSVLAGSDAVAITSEFENPVYSLVAKPEINSIAELKGKIVGLADESGSISISMRRLLALHGLHRGDFGVKVIEGTPPRLKCLLRGDCDAVVLGQPQDLQAIQQGYRQLGVSNDVVPDFLYTVTAVRRSWAEVHKDAITRYARAMAASFSFIRDSRNRESVIRTIAETTNCSDVIAAQTLDLLIDRDVLPKHAEIDLKGLGEVIAIMGEAGTLAAPLPRPDRFVDLQYLRSAGVQRK